MSFFKNLRSSMTRNRSSSRDTTPVRSSRPSSVLSTASRRDSIESKPDSIFNRSDTFILEGSDAEQQNHSNTSTLEKKSKKSKVLSKFNTFTKRKKSVSPADESPVNEHHPKDNATNTYYNWKSDGLTPSISQDTNTDPFNCLYEQQSSLKKRDQDPTETPAFDSSTYRKGGMPQHLKDQLMQLKKSKGKSSNLPLVEDDQEQEQDESEKYKTVTLDSFRKSFRDKFLQQEKQENYNPSWFVKVEPPTNSHQADQNRSRRDRSSDVLVFENENYRPESRSPIRERPSRSTTRSPVKRNETFKISRKSKSRSPVIGRKNSNKSAIHVEFKNSITPNMPGRMVPLGVAKPMPLKNNATPPSYLSPYTPKEDTWKKTDQQQKSHRNSISPAFNSTTGNSNYMKSSAKIDDKWKKSRDNLSQRRNSGSNLSGAPSYLKQYLPVDENWQNPELEYSGSRRNSISPIFNASGNAYDQRRNSTSSGIHKNSTATPSYLKQYLPVDENWQNPELEYSDSRRNSISPSFNASGNLLGQRRDSATSAIYKRSATPSYLKQYLPVDDSWKNSDLENSGSRRNSISPSFNTSAILHGQRRNSSGVPSYLKEYLPVDENWQNPENEQANSRRNSISPSFNMFQHSHIKPQSENITKLKSNQNRNINISSTKPTAAATETGRYQTKIQIGNQNIAKQQGPARIQLKSNHIANNKIDSNKHTYFGDVPLHASSNNRSSILMQKTNANILNNNNNNSNSNNSKYKPPTTASLYLNRGNTQKQQQQSSIQSHKVVIPMQRRSRSPIKMPWR